VKGKTKSTKKERNLPRVRVDPAVHKALEKAAATQRAIAERFAPPEWANPPQAHLGFGLWAIGPDGSRLPLEVGDFTLDDVAKAGSLEHGFVVTAQKTVSDGDLAGFVVRVEVEWRDEYAEPIGQIIVASPPVEWHDLATARALQRLSAQELKEEIPRVLAHESMRAGTSVFVPFAKYLHGERKRVGRAGHPQWQWLEWAALRTRANTDEHGHKRSRPVEWMLEELKRRGEHMSRGTLDGLLHRLRKSERDGGLELLEGNRRYPQLTAKAHRLLEERTPNGPR